ncbi:MAG: hypothetical protein ABIA67_00215, partial [Candidatus Margulisiibacteriota bacterium]
LKLSLQPRYLYETGGRRDIRFEFALNYQATRTYFLLGAGSFSEGSSGFHLRVMQELKDILGWGLDLSLRADKIGSKYRADFVEDDIYFLNNFDRPILDGTVDLGWGFSKKIGNEFVIEEKGTLSMNGAYKYGAGYPGTHLIEQISLKYNYSPKVDLEAFYRFYNVPSGVTQYGETVPEKSDLFGAGIKYAF